MGDTTPQSIPESPDKDLCVSTSSINLAPMPPTLIEEEQNLKLSDKNPKLKSKVWDHYKREVIDGKKKAICKYCQKSLGGDPRNGTSHLHDHQKRCQGKKSQDIRQQLLKSKRDINGKESLENFSYDQEVARQGIATMIVMHEYPIRMVEHFYFKKFLSDIQPLFKPVSRTTTRVDILKIYEHEKAKTMKLFEQNKSRVAITTDMWTSTNQKKGYMAVTTHYIDDEWVLRNRIIRFIFVPCPHTADVLCDELINCLMDWNLDTKLSTVTLDNCSTNDSLAKLIKYKLSSSNIWMGGHFIHMRCCAHILNLIVKDGLDVIKKTIENVRDSVAYWGYSPKRNEKFEETARQLKLNVTKDLVLDCQTRWNSTFLMLSVAIEYKDVFKRLKQRETRYSCCPSDEEWERAKQICDRLKVFFSVTELFSGTKYPTANLYFPKICQICIELNKWVCCGIDYIESMATEMKLKFDKYWNTIHAIMGVAIVLDPRFKLKFVEMYFPIIYGKDKGREETQKIRNLCYDLVNEYASLVKLNEPQGLVDEMSTQLKDNGGETDLINGFQKFVASSDGYEIDNAKSEFDDYLQEKLVRIGIDFDILSWWKNTSKYPALQLIAKDIFAIPISTVASESAFSTSGRVISPHRNRLKAQTVEALMCTQNWIKNSCSLTRDQPICGAFDEEEDEDDEEESLHHDASIYGLDAPI